VPKSSKIYPLRKIKRPAFTVGDRAKEIEALAAAMVAVALEKRRDKAFGRYGIKKVTSRHGGQAWSLKSGRVELAPQSEHSIRKSRGSANEVAGKNGGKASSKHVER
jgi:hypothetical protein